MNITQERKDELNAIIRIELNPADYQPRINKQLQDYTRKVAMPGFRPGKVPAGMVKKMYGKSILVDELNKITSESLFNYIRDNSLDILGNPLPHPENDNSLNLDDPGDIKLAFEIGLAPDFKLEVNSTQSFNLYKPLTDDDFVNKEVENYRNRVADFKEVEIAEANDVISGTLKELNADGTAKEGGIERQIEIHPADLREGDAQFFVGIQKEDVRNLNPKTVFVNPTVIASILNISTEEVEALQSEFSFTAHVIRRQAPAEINQEFFDKVFGPNTIFTEAEMRERIARDAEARFTKDSEARFFNEVVEHLVNNSNFPLPDDFLKRWLTSQNEGNVKAEDIEQNYTNYAKGIRWQLIENKLIRENQITVTREQAIESVANDFLGYMGGASQATEEIMASARSIAERMLSSEKEAQRVYDRLYNEALNRVFLSNFEVKEVLLSFDEWVAKISEPLN